MTIPVRQRREQAQSPAPAPSAPAAKPIKTKPPKPPKPKPEKPAPRPAAAVPPPSPKLEFGVYIGGLGVCAVEVIKAPADWIRLDRFAYDADLICRRRLLVRKKRKSDPPLVDLPKVPQMLDGLTPELPVLRGILVSKIGPGIRRPFVFIEVTCPNCAALHLIPWRGDWPLDPEIGLPVKVPCDDGVWRVFAVALDPARMAESVEVMRVAAEAFAVWKPAFEAGKKERLAVKKARKAESRAKAEAEKAKIT